MQRISLALNALLLIAVGILFYLYTTLNAKISGVQPENTKEVKAEAPKVFTDPSKMPDAKIAYVNIDSLDSKYKYISDYSKSIRIRQASLESSLNNMAAAFQQEYEAFQQSVKAGIKTEAELKRQQADLEQQQYNIANKERELQGIADEVAAHQREMLKNVSSFVAKYNNDKYDYILAYSSNIGSVLYAKPGYEITKEIIDGLNQEYEAGKKQVKK